METDCIRMRGNMNIKSHFRSSLATFIADDLKDDRERQRTWAFTSH